MTVVEMKINVVLQPKFEKFFLREKLTYSILVRKDSFLISQLKYSTSSIKKIKKCMTWDDVL